MQATGIVRLIDDLGRVVIPQEIRRTLHIRERDPFEIFIMEDGGILLKKRSQLADLSKFAEEYYKEAYKTDTEIIKNLTAKAKELERRAIAAEKELDKAQPCFACAGFKRNGGKCFGAGTCRVRDIARLSGVKYKDLAHGESWRWRGPDKVEI
ncbi:MAG TPA: hypothetical protein P5158_11785 [Chitinophagaceae bacterium]|jgi:AbrB family looped-hinge helix DNA binding protein|nr:hypothetical protein [Chitinophagaceae bacterium]